MQVPDVHLSTQGLLVASACIPAAQGYAYTHAVHFAAMNSLPEGCTLGSWQAQFVKLARLTNALSDQEQSSVICEFLIPPLL